MASVLFTWSDMWLKWYNLQDVNVKQEFVNQIELEKTISMSPAKMQIEMLECAPPEIKEFVKSVLQPKARKFLFDEQIAYAPHVQIDWQKIYRETITCQ